MSDAVYGDGVVGVFGDAAEDVGDAGGACCASEASADVSSAGSAAAW